MTLYQTHAKIEVASKMAGGSMGNLYLPAQESRHGARALARTKQSLGAAFG